MRPTKFVFNCFQKIFESFRVCIVCIKPVMVNHKVRNSWWYFFLKCEKWYAPFVDFILLQAPPIAATPRVGYSEQSWSTQFSPVTGSIPNMPLQFAFSHSCPHLGFNLPGYISSSESSLFESEIFFLCAVRFVPCGTEKNLNFFFVALTNLFLSNWNLLKPLQLKIHRRQHQSKVFSML